MFNEFHVGAQQADGLWKSVWQQYYGLKWATELQDLRPGVFHLSHEFHWHVPLSPNTEVYQIISRI